MLFILSYIFISVPFLLFSNKYEMNTGKHADSLVIKQFNHQSLVPCTKIRHLTEKSQDHEICSLSPKLHVGSSLRELSNHLGKQTLHKLLCARWGTENGETWNWNFYCRVRHHDQKQPGHKRAHLNLQLSGHTLSLRVVKAGKWRKKLNQKP